jgi:hypothetical protein
VRLLLGARNVRRDDVDVMTATTGLAGKKMNVLADPAKMRVVVLRHQRNPQRALVTRELERRELREGGMTTTRAL